MLGKILSGFVGPVSQQSPATAEQADVKPSEIVQQPQQDSAESILGARSNAFERMSETGISSRMLATQLQSQLDSIKSQEEAEKAKEAAKTWSMVGPVIIVPVAEVISLDWNEIAPLKPDAESDPASKITTESSDQKESLVPK